MSKELFTSYFYNNTWQGVESVSGPGSDSYLTHNLIREMNALIKFFDIKSILDIPCGDWNYMKHIELDGISYIGADIVDPLIEQNRQKYESDTITFEVLDIRHDYLPTVDLIIVRDCLVHLPNKDIVAALENIKRSESQYLLTTTFNFLSQEVNKDIEIGDWRKIDLMRSPFELISPLRLLMEVGSDWNTIDKCLGLWSIDQIQVGAL
jgi:hypothetical protein